MLKKRNPLLIVLAVIFTVSCLLTPNMPATITPQGANPPVSAGDGTAVPSQPHTAAPGTPASPASPTPTWKAAATLTLTPTSTEEFSLPPLQVFDIDYRQPALFLRSGEQSRIPDPAILPSVADDQTPIEQLGVIFHWLQDDFSSYSAGGATIGKVTVEELLEKRSLGGCHDYGLVFSAAARAIGYPALMVETYRISWMKAYQEGTSQGYQGHIFVEVFLEDHWVLVDPTRGQYVAQNYDPGAKVIPLPGSSSDPPEERDGHYVDLKGIDSWAMGIYSAQDLNQLMEQAAGEFDPAAISFPEYSFQQFQ